MSSAYDLVCQRLAERTGGSGRNGSWPCPAHDDSTPSLSVSRGRGGADAAVHCHAGCTTPDVMAALDLTMTDLFDKPRSNGDSEIVATYDYVDEQGQLLFQVARKYPKAFLQRRPDGAGGWVWKLGDTRRVLYRLPQLLEAIEAGDDIFLVEGEKDADRLAADGYVATCNPHGAGKWRPGYNATLKGADVVIVADRDKAGSAHARHVAEQLEGIAASVKVAQAAVGKDVSDHLAAGLTVEELELLTLDNLADDSADKRTLTGQPAADGDSTDALWDERFALQQLRDFARARRCSPWAVLGASLARLAAAVPPFVVLPPLVGSHASLNLYIGLVGPSGAGKDAAINAAGDALDVGPVITTGPGSGEGIAHQFVTYRRPNPKNDDPGGLEQHTTSVLFIASEVDTLRALAGRQASTLAPELRKAWTGSELGFAYVDREKRLRLTAHTYRLGLIVGIQPERAGAILDDSDAGTPQRFLWLPVGDLDAPDTPPVEPAPLRWEPPHWPSIRPKDHGLVTLDVCDEARQAIDQARLARLRLEADALDAHALLARLKVAALLALLDNRTTVEPDDWHLAGLVLRRSDSTRAGVVTALQASARATNEARAHLEADRDEVRESRQVQRVARRLLAALRSNGGWMVRRDLRGRLSGQERTTAFEPAVDSLVAAGQVEREEFEGQGRSGTRYRAVDQ